MIIRQYKEEEANTIADLYHDSVHAVNNENYTSAQLEAWAPTPPDYTIWQDRLKKQNPYVCLIDSVIVGFIELEADGYINCTYTHPDYQREGIGSALYLKVEDEAKNMGLDRLYVHTSLLAIPLFKKFGFTITNKNEVKRRGQILTNFTMEKSLK